MGHGPWIWNYRFGCATSWTKTCKVHKIKKNRMPGTNHQCNKRSWNDISQLILWIYLHQANRYELRPAIPVQPSELKCTNNMIYYSETVEFYTRFWNDISQLILWIYLHYCRALDMNLDPPFLYNLLNKNEETNLIYHSETVEFCIRFWNHISQLIPWICLHKGPKIWS